MPIRADVSNIRRDDSIRRSDDILCDTVSNNPFSGRYGYSEEHADEGDIESFYNDLPPDDDLPTGDDLANLWMEEQLRNRESRG